MESYPSNPNQPQLPEGDKKNVKAKATEIQRSKFGKILDAIVSEDVQNLKKYVVMNVIIPRLGKMVIDFFNLGSNTPVPTPDSDGRIDYTSPQKVRVVGSSNMVQPYKDETVSKKYEFKRLGYNYQRQAQDVLDQLREDIREYKMATLLHYYEYSDVETESTENNYGWKNLDDAEVYYDRVSQMWVIKLPKVQLLG